MDLGLKGKTAVVTGASEGIGRATARVLAREGVDLHLSARSTDRLNGLKDELEGAFGVAVACHPLDLSKSENQAALASAASHSDILVNSAGAIPKGKIHEILEPQWREVWDLKVFSTINLCRDFYGFMKARGSGVILNIIGNGGMVHKGPLF